MYLDTAGSPPIEYPRHDHASPLSQRLANALPRRMGWEYCPLIEMSCPEKTGATRRAVGFAQRCLYMAGSGLQPTYGSVSRRKVRPARKRLVPPGLSSQRTAVSRSRAVTTRGYLRANTGSALAAPSKGAATPIASTPQSTTGNRVCSSKLGLKTGNPLPLTSAHGK
jgi:hypothetical protein